MVGAIWGVFVSCGVVAIVTFVLPASDGLAYSFVSSGRAVLYLGACGVASGVAYSLVSRVVGTESR
jgi:hypothetical protein